MTFYKKSSFTFLILEILISVVFIINIINITFINLSNSSPIAYGLTNEDRYNSGFVHECNDAKDSDNGSKHSYLDNNGGPSTHTDTFMKGYDAGYKKCLTSPSPVASNTDDNTSLFNKDQLTLSLNTKPGNHLNTSSTLKGQEAVSDKGCADVKNGDNQNLFQLEKGKRLTNNIIKEYHDGFQSCFDDIRMCPSISYDGSIVAYTDTKNNDTVISSGDTKGALSKITTINSTSCPILSGNGKEVSYEKPDSKSDSDVSYLVVTDLSNILFPSSTSNLNTLKNTTSTIDNDYGYGLDRSLDMHQLSFNGKVIAYDYVGIGADDAIDVHPYTSTKNSHGHFQKPINITTTYLKTDIPSNPGLPSVALSGDGKNIVFNNQTDAFNDQTDTSPYEIYTTKVDNPNKIEQVTIKGVNSDNTYNYFPDVSYNGKTIAYISNNGIYVAKLNDDGEWITSNVVSNSTFNNIIDANNTRFSLSPDGNKIAYTAFDGSYKQVFVKDISNMLFNNNDKDQSNDKSIAGRTIQVTHDNFNHFEPVLSYDGSKVAFQSGDKVVVKDISEHS